MKRILVLIVAMIFAFQFGYAQDKKASIGIGIGGAAASAKGLDGVKDSGFGFNFYLNGMYNLTSNFSAGVEWNGNAVIIAGIDPNGLSLDFQATSINGILAKGRYAFGDGGTRFFGGIMLGAYIITPGSVSLSGSSSSLQIGFDKKTTFGFAPEIGVMMGSFQLATSYHFPGKYKGSVINLSGGTEPIEETYTVWQFNLGWNIGFIDN